MYRIAFTKRALKDLQRIRVGDAKLHEALKDAIKALQDDPTPMGSRLLSDRQSYRLRVREYRVLYTIDKGHLLIEVVRVGPRGDFYKK